MTLALIDFTGWKPIPLEAYLSFALTFEGVDQHG